jgi:hypothetical protein
LSPALQLPPAFGSAYVGNTFGCTLCANNELEGELGAERRISGVRIEVEMKTPSSTITLLPETKDGAEEEPKELEEAERGDGVLAVGGSLQKVIGFHLKEEGSHVLAVTVTYSETGKSSGRVRTFRKLYQFVAKSCLVVRTKTGGLGDVAVRDAEGKEGRRKRWALEAQLENVGEEGIVLEASINSTAAGLKC